MSKSRTRDGLAYTATVVDTSDAFWLSIECDRCGAFATREEAVAHAIEAGQCVR